jgi:hypothetical protein
MEKIWNSESAKDILAEVQLKQAQNKMRLYDRLINRECPELEAALDKIDFELLETIFFNKISKYVRGENIRKKFLSRWRIANDELLTSEGLYDADISAIFINTEKLKEHHENTKIQELKILHIVCHEETHALTHFEHTAVDNDNDFIVIQEKIGFDKTLFSINKIPEGASEEEKAEALKNQTLKVEQFFHFLNEGITEKFARRIFEEYVSYKVDLTNDEREEYHTSSAYASNVTVFEILCEDVAQKLGVESSYIEEAFYSSMFGGDDLADPELQKAIDEIKYPGFSKYMFNFEFKEEL